MRSAKREPVPNPLVRGVDGRYQMDLVGLEAAASDASVRLMILCNPHNPVGRVWTREELSRLDAICRRYGVLVVSDEIHADITFPGHRYVPFASLGEAAAAASITCLSPAKSFNLAACCSAFTVVTDDGRRAALQAENSRLTVNKNNAFASVAMEAAYRDGGPWLDAVIEYIAGNVALVRERLAPLPGVTMIEPEGTFLLWLDFRALDLEPDALTAFLRGDVGWGVTRGPAFGAEGVGFCRLNVACTRARLGRAIDGLEASLRE